jgi:hypothetical protein
MPAWPDAPPSVQEHRVLVLRREWEWVRQVLVLHLESEQEHPVWESPPEWELQAWELHLESEQEPQALALSQPIGVDP